MTTNINVIAESMQFVRVSKKLLQYRFVQEQDDLVPLSYTVSNKQQSVVTYTTDGKETENVADVGDIIMSGISNERYVLRKDKFPKLYLGEIGSTVTNDQTPRAVARYTGEAPVSFLASWGEQMILKPNDYLVKEPDGTYYYRIAKAEFEQTYNSIDK